jgi:hypothetical protein
LGEQLSNPHLNLPIAIILNSSKSISRKLASMFHLQFVYSSRLKIKTGQIRLITLYPGREDSKIRCRLDSAALSEGPVFEALSYEWGDHNYNKPNPAISLNGRRFIVRPNLGFALNHLRDPSKERVLWIDTICINQGDEDEKAIQIGQMGRVYSQAAVC